jgi:hypothetical protein
MNDPTLRSLFEQIIRDAKLLLSRPADRYVISENIVGLCEQGISMVTHTVIEVRPPVWEEHTTVEAKERQIPRWMMERGVEGDFFNPHFENRECKEAGCRPAFPSEMPYKKPFKLIDNQGNVIFDSLDPGSTSESEMEHARRTMTPEEFEALYTNISPYRSGPLSDWFIKPPKEPEPE